MAEPSQASYKYSDVVVTPSARRVERAGTTYQIKPQAAALLAELLENPAEVIPYARLLKVIAPDSATATIHQLHVLKNGMADALGAQAYGCIEAVPGKGYRLDAAVTKELTPAADAEASDRTPDILPSSGETSAAGSAEERELPHTPTPERTARLEVTEGLRRSVRFGRHTAHIYSSCIIYALLYVAALLLEVAYRFEELGAAALRTTPPVFVCVFGASLAGLVMDRRYLLRGKGQSPFRCGLLFAAAALAAYWLAGRVLPAVPVTQAKIQTFPAHGAYLKSVCYFLPLGWVYVINLFHTVIALEHEVISGRSKGVLSLLSGGRRGVAPPGTIYLKPRWLVILLLGLFVLALAMMAHLFDNLQPGEHMNLFTTFAFMRGALYFALALECLAWYSHALNDIKLKCLELTEAATAS